MTSQPPNPSEGHPLRADAPTWGPRLLDAFESIADLPAIEREAALEALRIESPELERAVRALLARDARTGPLDRPLAADLEPLLREALPELDSVPAQIGPYQVLRPLGEGGMGRVYLARRSEGPISREVALKLIRPDRAGEGLLARFEAERRHLAALDHPGICRFIDADSLADGTPYVVMEAVHGEPIIDYCQRHALGLRARVELLRQLLAAVAHAHDRLLLHRDIKPHNVLVTADGQPKLLDFGIAKSIEDAHASVTRTAERFFTPNASAPEQLLGQPAGVACDVYSLGALAYELLGGALPFDFQGLRAAEIERLILQVAPPLISERSTEPWARELRGDLDAIIATCLRKSPAERYPNVGALDAELQRWLEGRPVGARAPSWAYRSRLFVRRHRTAVGLSAALGLAIAVFGTGLALQSLELREQRNLAVIERDRALQVVEILESAFRNADPGQSAGDKVTARQILDAAIPAIDAMENDQPALFARLAATLAKVELSLNQPVKAADWANRGLASSRPNAADKRDVETLLFVGVMSNAQSGNHITAGKLMEELEASDPTNTLEAELAKARYLASTSKMLDAISVLERTKSSPPAQNPQSEAAHSVRWLLAELLVAAREFEKAESIFEETISWQSGRVDENHPWFLISKMERVRLLSKIRPSTGLANEIRDLIPSAESIFGTRSLRFSVLKNALGVTLFQTGEPQEGINHMLEAIRTRSEIYSQHSPTVIQSKINVSGFLAIEGSSRNLELAASILESASTDALHAFGINAPVAFLSKTRYCEALIRLENWGAAATCIESTDVFSDNARRHRSTQASLDSAARAIRGSPICRGERHRKACIAEE